MPGPFERWFGRRFPRFSSASTCPGHPAASCHKAPVREEVGFLSYSSSDDHLVRRLVNDLITAGIKVWFYEEGISAGQRLINRIDLALSEATFFIAVVSTNWHSSEWPKWEMEQALVRQLSGQDLTIIPVKIDDAEIPRCLANIRWVDFSKSYEDGVAHLIQDITKLKGELPHG